MSRTIASVQRVNRDAWGWAHGFGWTLSLLIEPRDLWVGVFWTWDTGGMLSIYLCVVPCVPIRLTLWGLR